MRRLTYIAASTVAAAILSGCVIVDADVRESNWGAHGDFGYLYGAEVSGRGTGLRTGMGTWSATVVTTNSTSASAASVRTTARRLSPKDAA